MTILDTNVVSELVSPAPDASVRAWLARQNASDLFVTSITKGEMLYGVALLPPGRRKAALHAQVARVLAEDFDGRILPFDEQAAEFYSVIMATRRRLGRPISPLDAQIASIARSHGAALATRNTGDFLHTDVTLENPFGHAVH